MTSAKETPQARYDRTLREAEQRVQDVLKRYHPPSTSGSTALREKVNTFAIGLDADNHPVRVTNDDRATHELIMGRSGLGKSRFIEHHLRHDIRKGFGACLIDPDGSSPDSVFNNTLRWLKANGYDKRTDRKIRIIDLTSTDYVTSLNPFFVPGHAITPDPYILARILVNVFERVWKQDFMQTPTIRKLLAAIFVSLIENKLTLADAPILFQRAVDEHGLRAKIVRKTQNRSAKLALQDLDELTHATGAAANRPGLREYRSEVTGPFNRIEEFTNTQIVQQMFSGGGHGSEALDLRRVMDNQEILLVNLSSNDTTADDTVSKLVGTWLVREFTRQCVQRLYPKRRFYLYIDEAADYLSDDVVKILDRSRKRGLSLVMAIQRLGQLRDVSDNIYNAVLTNPNIFSVFGGLEHEDAKIMVNNIVKLNLEKPVEASIRPTQTGEFEIVELKNSSHADSTAQARSLASSQVDVISHQTFSGRSGAESSNSGETMSPMIGPDGTPMVIVHAGAASSAGFNEGEASGMARALGSTDTQTDTLGSTDTEGTAQTFRPIFADMPTSFHSLESVRHEMSWYLQSAPKRKFYMSVNRESAVLLAVPNIDTPKVSDEDLAAFKLSLFKADPAALELKKAEKVIEDRPNYLLEYLDRTAEVTSANALDVGDPPQFEHVAPIGEDPNEPVADNVIYFNPGASVPGDEANQARPSSFDTDGLPIPGTFQIIAEDQTGITFDAMFGACFVGLRHVSVQHTFISAGYIQRLWAEFLDTVVNCKQQDETVRVDLVTNKDDPDPDKQERGFEAIQNKYEKHGVTFNWTYMPKQRIHARSFVTDTGWRITLDRGLDTYKHNRGPQDKRPNRGNEIHYFNT